MKHYEFDKTTLVRGWPLRIEKFKFHNVRWANLSSLHVGLCGYGGYGFPPSKPEDCSSGACLLYEAAHIKNLFLNPHFENLHWSLGFKEIFSAEAPSELWGICSCLRKMTIDDLSSWLVTFCLMLLPCWLESLRGTRYVELRCTLHCTFVAVCQFVVLCFTKSAEKVSDLKLYRPSCWNHILCKDGRRSLAFDDSRSKFKNFQ